MSSVTINANQILLSSSGGTQQMVQLNTFYAMDVTLSSSNTTNTTTNILYTLSSDLTIPSTVYLWRFNGVVDLSGYLNTSLAGASRVSSVVIPVSPDLSGSIFDPSLNPNSTYTYAFYNGISNGSSIILTDNSNNNVITEVNTLYIFNSVLTSTFVDTSNATFHYQIDNSGEAATVYLYRYDGPGFSVPTNLTVAGSNILIDGSAGVFCPSGQIITGDISDNTILPNNNYSYAFYVGNILNESPIMRVSSTNSSPQIVSIGSFYDIVVQLFATDVSINTASVNFQVQNSLSNPTSAYLKMFTGKYNAIDISTLTPSIPYIDISNVAVDAKSTTILLTQDVSGLMGQTYYTFALYNGNGTGSTILVDNSENPVLINVLTNNWNNPITYPVNNFAYTGINKTLYSLHFTTNNLDGTGWNNSNANWSYTGALNGTLSGTTPNLLQYQSNPGFVGLDTFTYNVNPTYTGIDTSSQTYTSNTSTVNITVIPPPPPCFKEGSKILCLKDNMEEEYRAIETIRPGTLVKTHKHGYVPVKYIGTSQLYNSGTDVRKIDKLYRCSKAQYPEMCNDMDDLILTGCHCILVDELSENEKVATMTLYDTILITDDKYRLSACFDDRAVPYEFKGTYNIWHLALEHEDYYMNYGIYAHGLLVETCSQRSILEMSHMNLVL